MSDIAECPYCGYENEIDYEEYQDMGDFIRECDNCGKVFNVHPEVSIYFDTSECQCQGVDHEWELSETYPRCCSKMVCIYCGLRRDLTEEERKQYNVETVAKYCKRLNRDQG